MTHTVCVCGDLQVFLHDLGRGMKEFGEAYRPHNIGCLSMTWVDGGVGWGRLVPSSGHISEQCSVTVLDFPPLTCLVGV